MRGPRASAVAMGNGDLTQVVNIKGKYSNGAKLKHTLRKSPSGYTLGHRESETGEERDWNRVRDATRVDRYALLRRFRIRRAPRCHA